MYEWFNLKSWYGLGSSFTCVCAHTLLSIVLERQRLATDVTPKP